MYSTVLRVPSRHGIAASIIVHTEGYKDVGPLVFDRTEYEGAIKKAL